MICLKPALKKQQSSDSLDSELVCSHGDAVDKLHGAPQPMKLHTFVYMHHAVAGQRAAPDRVVQITTDASQDDFKHGESATQPLFGQQVTLTSDGNLLMRNYLV